MKTPHRAYGLLCGLLIACSDDDGAEGRSDPSSNAGDGGVPNGDAQGPKASASSCRGALSGAVNGSFGCFVSFPSDHDRELWLLPSGPIDGIEHVAVIMRVDNPFAPRTYSLTELASASAIVRSNGGTQYVATKDVPEASLVLTLTAVGPVEPISTSTHGTLTVHAVEVNPQGGVGPGRVDVGLTF